MSYRARSIVLLSLLAAACNQRGRGGGGNSPPGPTLADAGPDGGGAVLDAPIGPPPPPPPPLPDTGVFPRDTAVPRDTWRPPPPPPDTGPAPCPEAPPFPPVTPVCGAAVEACIASAATQAEFNACLAGEPRECLSCLNLTVLECAVLRGCDAEFNCWYECVDSCGTDDVCITSRCSDLEDDMAACVRLHPICQDASSGCFLPPALDAGIRDAGSDV